MNILVIGGSGDIGKAICRVFVNHDIYAPTRKEMDLLNPASIERWFDDKPEFHSVIYAAGINIVNHFENITPNDLDDIFSVNVAGFLAVASLVLPNTKRIVAISSLYGHLAREGRLAYTMSKHSLNGAVKTLALEYAKDNVLVNCISPGFIKTRMTTQNNDAAVLDKIKSRIPMQRLGLPEDIARTAYFLTMQNNYITGQDIIVDGGFSINGGV